MRYASCAGRRLTAPEVIPGRGRREAFLAEARAAQERGVPRYVERELRAYLEMGRANFSVGPFEVAAGQTLELIVIMLPMVWMETVSVSPDALDRLGYGVLGAAIGFEGGPVGAVAGFFYGLLSPHDEDVDVPCFNSVIMARNVFTAADLDRIASAGIERLGPQDNESYVVCHQPIDAYYSLVVNQPGYGFATTPTPRKQLCTLEPRAYLPVQEQIERDWGDVGDRLTDCIQVTVTAQSATHADVEILQRSGGAYKTIAQFVKVKITRAVPSPDFQRNFFDDGCPARTAKPDCPDCLRFVNLPMTMVANRGLLYLGMLPGSHVGSRPVFPVRFDSDRATVERRTSRCCPAHDAPQTPPTTATANRSARARADGKSPSKKDAVLVAGDGGAAALPIRLGERHQVVRVGDDHVRLWPTGTVPVRDDKGVAPSHERFIEHDIYLPTELALSWQLICSPQFTLSTYQELTGEGGCRARLRYTRRDPNGAITADVMLSRLPAALR